MKKLLAGLVVGGLAGSVVVEAVLTVPYTFSPFTTISSSQVNANFSAITANGLDKRGDTMTGTLVTQTITPDVTGSRDLGSSALRFNNLWLSGTLTGTTGSFTTLSLSSPLSIANGGTNGTAAPTTGGVAYGTGTAYAVTAAGTAGQYLTSTGSGAPIWFGGTAADNLGNCPAACDVDFRTRTNLTVSLTYTQNTLLYLYPPKLAGTVVVELHHDATGNAYTLGFSTVVKWPNGTVPTFTNAPNAIDIVTLYWNGTTWFGVAQTNFS